eukprot:CAMPEP_0177780436 /NCGR_PEP_ID=MMETSP0491_2-20121128/17200_1 /TAXON_ID=63592 /ORGANISM="Tetraselmis chuii, Strain PLY429" /LENGTH=300 /DNA_ID=CAMNT_0019300203 /DNA_START=160 /DNA_END=1059 /DNA_ORIENTATION=-
MEALNAAVGIPVPLIRGGAVLKGEGADGGNDDWMATCPPAGIVDGSHCVRLRYGRTAYCLKDVSPEPWEENDSDGRPVVVLIHGLGFWSYVWTRLADSLLATGRCKAVLVYDRYGRGFSDVAVDPTAEQPVRHSADLFAQQLDDLLLAVRLRSGKKLREERLVLGGTSMGGLIATKFAAVNPKLVVRLVLMAPCGLKPPVPFANLDTQLIRVWGIGHALYACFGGGTQLRMMRQRKFRDDVPDLEKTNPSLLTELTAAMTWQLQQKPGYGWDFYRDVAHMPWGGMQEEVGAVGRETGMDV